MVKLNKKIKSTDFEKLKKLKKRRFFRSVIKKNKGNYENNFFNLGPEND